MRNVLMKVGRRKAGTWGPPRKSNKRVANKAVRRYLKKDIRMKSIPGSVRKDAENYLGNFFFEQRRDGYVLHYIDAWRGGKWTIHHKHKGSLIRYVATETAIAACRGRLWANNQRKLFAGRICIEGNSPEAVKLDAKWEVIQKQLSEELAAELHTYLIAV